MRERIYKISKVKDEVVLDEAVLGTYPQFPLILAKVGVAQEFVCEPIVKR